MRLFIALALPSSVVAELTRVQQQLRHATGTSAVKWVDPHSIHITLLFVGEVETPHVQPLIAALNSATWSDTTTNDMLHLTHVGAFPTPKKPTVVWVGLGGDVARLHQLRQLVIACVAPLGFAPDAKRFQPHLTLGRVRRTASPEQVAHLSAALTSTTGTTHQPQPIAWHCGTPILFHSTLTPSGAIYKKMTT